MKTTVTILAILAAVLVLSSGCHSWTTHQTVNGIAYSRVRHETVRGEVITIGELEHDVEIDGETYTGWLHRRENGSISGGMIATGTVINGVTVPPKTWVSFDDQNRLSACHFPESQVIQGHKVRGTGGGVKGATVKFHPSGKLRLFFAPTDVTIQGIPCRGSLLKYIVLHENGNLKQCTLSTDTTVDGRQIAKGTTIELDPAGNLVE